MECSIAKGDRSILYGDMISYENDIQLREEPIKIVVERNVDCQSVQTASNLRIFNHKFMYFVHVDYPAKANDIESVSKFEAAGISILSTTCDKGTVHNFD